MSAVKLSPGCEAFRHPDAGNAQFPAQTRVNVACTKMKWRDGGLRDRPFPGLERQSKSSAFRARKALKLKNRL
jgi:hypothetical protein